MTDRGTNLIVRPTAALTAGSNFVMRSSSSAPSSSSASTTSSRSLRWETRRGAAEALKAPRPPPPAPWLRSQSQGRARARRGRTTAHLKAAATLLQHRTLRLNYVLGKVLRTKSNNFTLYWFCINILAVSPDLCASAVRRATFKVNVTPPCSLSASPPAPVLLLKASTWIASSSAASSGVRPLEEGSRIHPVSVEKSDSFTQARQKNATNQRGRMSSIFKTHISPPSILQYKRLALTLICPYTELYFCARVFRIRT